MHRVAITGIGVLTPAGCTPESLWQRALAGRTAIAAMPVQHPGLRFTHTAEIPGFLAADHLAPSEALTTERCAQFGLVAARLAAAASGLLRHYAPDEIAILTGCSTAGRQAEEPETAKLYRDNARVHPLTVVRTMASNGASHIAIALGVTGPALNLSTACASGAHALGTAFRMVRSGEVRAAIAGGHEAPLTFGFLRAWDSMRVVCPTGGCRPFAADRDGMTLAEGAAYLTLEPLDAAEARGATVYAELIGYGMSTDAHHITQPKPEGPAAAMRAALRDAGRTLGREVLPAEVGYLNAHGTATQSNDAVEAAAIHAVFGERTPPVSSTKGLHGHAIGASPAIEAALAALALFHGQLPPTANTTVQDPGLALDLILANPRPTGPTIALSNSLAFGGLNAVLAFQSHVPAPERLS